MGTPFTRIEQSSVRDQGTVTTVTHEKLNVTSINDLDSSVPAGAQNIKRVWADDKLTVTYEIQGAQSASSTSGFTPRAQRQFALTASLSQEPLETAPGLASVTAAIWQKWRKWLANPDDTTLAGWKPEDETNEKFAKFYELYNKGIEDYLSPRVTLRITRTDRSYSLDKLGKITSPTGAPRLPSGASWLFAGIDVYQEGSGELTITEEYLSSGPNGWNTDIYGTA